MEYIDELTIPHSVEVVEAQRGVWLSGPTCIRHEVVGESHNPDQMRAILARLRGHTNAVLSAWLMPEPSNAYDPNAVVVWIFGGRVGYLARPLAARWQSILARLQARHGAPVACQGMLDPPTAANGGELGVAIWLPALPELPAYSQRNHVAPAFVQPPSQTVPVMPAAPPSVSQVQVITAVAKPPAPPPTPEELEQLRADIAATKKELDRAKRELRSVEESLDIQAFGFYQPKYGFESSSQYTSRLKTVRDEQQALIKADNATHCDTQWKVGGSAAEGKKMVRNQSKLMLRAFNGECDAAIAKVRYDNVTTLEERITKSLEAVNKLGLVQQVSITHRYFALKLAELRLVHEHREKVQEEKEEQKRVKEQMREEQQALADIEKAKAEAEKQEAASAAALEKARAELAAAANNEKQHEKLEALVTRLETELSSALDRKAKAIARAQLTRSGHVYVLSNIGSFGEGIFKIGMTRRIEPLERVDELGDASVPFPFDVHAIIYAADAPALENQLHKMFAHRRVNMVNHRKEYFRVTLDDVRVAVEKLHGLVTFLLVPEAEEFRKTQAAIVVPPESSEVVLALPEAPASETAVAV